MLKGLSKALPLILVLLLVVLGGCSDKGGGSAADSGIGAGKQTASATQDRVRLVGRTYTRDGATWLAQSGSAVEFKVTGTSLSIELVGDKHVHNDAELRPRFAILVDGEVVLDDTLSEEARTVEVFAGEEKTSAVVEVIQLSEALRGGIGVKSITVKTDAPNPVTPTAAKDLSIEFIGDSITCAYGVESAGHDDPFKTTTENFLKSYAYLAAQELGADYSAVCYSGYGVVSGWSADGTRNESMLVPPLYELVVAGQDQAWDFDAHRYDAVVINLGTNDYSYTCTVDERMAEFARGYADFLADVRAHNPEAYIICTFGTMEVRELYPALEQAVALYTSETGDARVSCYLSDAIDIEADGVGTMDHPTATTQQKAANKLVQVIREALELEA